MNLARNIYFEDVGTLASFVRELKTYGWLECHFLLIWTEDVHVYNVHE